MITFRLRLPAAVLAVIATGLLGTATAQASQARTAVAADIDTITVNDAFSNPDESGLLFVDITATTGVTSVTAHIRATGSNTDSFTVTNFQAPADTTNGTWTAQAPIPAGSGIGELPYGTYDISIEATDQGGTSSTLFPGALQFLIQPVLTLSASPMTGLDFDHRDVTFSGSLTGNFTDGSSAPLTNPPAIDINGASDSAIAIANGSGNYQTPHTINSASYTATLAPGDSTLNYAFASSGPVDLTNGITRDAVHIQAHLAKQNVKFGDTDTVTGTVTYQSDATAPPLPGGPVTVTEITPPGPSVHGITDGNGNFTITLPKQRKSGTWQVTAGGTLFFDTAAVNLPFLHVALPTGIRKLSLRLDPFAVLHAKACVVFTDAADQARQPSTPIRIEYSAHKSGPWRLLGKMFPGNVEPGYCPGARTWRHSFRVPLANAYYRARVVATPGLQAAVTSPVHRWKYLTRIRSLTVSSTHVARGGKLTVSGRLQQHVGSWKPYGQRVVLIVLRPAGQRRWFWIKKVRTHSTGRFSSTFTDPTSATWSAVYEGDKTHFAGGGRLIFVSNSVLMNGQAGRWVELAGPGPHLLPGGALPAVGPGPQA